MNTAMEKRSIAQIKRDAARTERARILKIVEGFIAYHENEPDTCCSESQYKTSVSIYREITKEKFE